MKRIDKVSLLFFAIYICVFFGSFNKIFTFVSIFIDFLLAILIANNAVKEKNKNVCIQLILLLCFQNFLIGTGAHLSKNSDESLKFLTQVPFLVSLVIWFFFKVKDYKSNKKISKEEKYFLLLIVFIILSMVQNRGNIQSILINIRNMTIFFMAYEIGKYFLRTIDDFEFLINKYNIILFFMLIVGIILLVCGYSLYSIIGINEVYIAKSDANLNGVLNSRFYTTLLSFKIVRMGSLYYEPVNLSYLFSIGFIVNLFYKPTNKSSKVLNILISGIGLLLTFGKGGWLIALSCILFITINKFFAVLLKGVNNKTIYRFSMVFAILLIVSFCVYAYKNLSTSANPHFWGVIRTWENIKRKPLGYGLGTGGNMAFALNTNLVSSYDSNNAWLSSGGESAIFSFAYQIGIFGILFFILCLVSITKNYKKGRDTFNRIMKFLPIIIIGVGILQENTFTPQCIIPFMIFQGCCSNIFKENTDKIKT